MALYLLLVSLGVAVCYVAEAISYLHNRLTKARRSDYEAINELMKARSLRTVSVAKTGDYFYYWLRGKNISNCTRIYIIIAERPSGSRCQMHVGFDPFRLDTQWPSRGALQVLLEKELPSRHC